MVSLDETVDTKSLVDNDNWKMLLNLSSDCVKRMKDVDFPEFKTVIIG